MLTIALTGGIGSGKSSVCKLFAQHHIPIIDTDEISREIVEPGQPALEAIVSSFGPDVLNSSGSLNRKQLASIVFKSSEKRQQLEIILHPRIRDIVQQRIKQLTSPYCIIAIPLLFETSQQQVYDRILVIDCNVELQIQRVLQRDQRSREEIEAIIAAQVDRQQRLQLADDIIDNNYGLKELSEQVDLLHQKYISLTNSTIV